MGFEKFNKIEFIAINIFMIILLVSSFVFSNGVFIFGVVGFSIYPLMWTTSMSICIYYILHVNKKVFGDCKDNIFFVISLIMLITSLFSIVCFVIDIMQTTISNESIKKSDYFSSNITFLPKFFDKDGKIGYSMKINESSVAHDMYGEYFSLYYYLRVVGISGLGIGISIYYSFISIFYLKKGRASMSSKKNKINNNDDDDDDNNNDDNNYDNNDDDNYNNNDNKKLLNNNKKFFRNNNDNKNSENKCCNFTEILDYFSYYFIWFISFVIIFLIYIIKFVYIFQSVMIENYIPCIFHDYKDPMLLYSSLFFIFMGFFFKLNNLYPIFCEVKLSGYFILLLTRSIIFFIVFWASSEIEGRNIEICDLFISSSSPLNKPNEHVILFNDESKFVDIKMHYNDIKDLELFNIHYDRLIILNYVASYSIYFQLFVILLMLAMYFVYLNNERIKKNDNNKSFVQLKY